MSSSGGLDGLRKRIPDIEQLDLEAKRFQVLSDPIRLQIIYLLHISDLCPCIIKEITGLPDSKLSYHLNILEEEGMICSSPRKRWRIYSITDLGRSQLVSSERTQTRR